MFSSKRKIWITAVLVVLFLRFGIGPLMVVVQFIAGYSTFEGSCGNSQYRMPNADLLSWWESGNKADVYEQACVDHDHCYQTVGQIKSACDRVFLRDLKADCRILDAPERGIPVRRLACTLQAEAYFFGVLVMPPVHYAYCIEQYYARAGTRDISPDPADVIRECWSDR